jgi:phosphatidylglycerophosphate synthase
MNWERERGSVRICGLFFSCLRLLQVGEGPEALGQVVRLLLLGWSLDILDGILARASGRPSPLAAWDYPRSCKDLCVRARV